MSNSVETQELRKLYEQGLSLKKVGKQFGITRQAVQLRFKAAGIPRRDPSAAVHKVDVKVLRRLIEDDQLNVIKAAKLLGVPVTLVRRVANENRIKRGHRSLKFPTLNGIQIGESIIVPNGKTAYENYIQFYRIGCRMGIKLVRQPHRRSNNSRDQNSLGCSVKKIRYYRLMCKAAAVLHFRENV